MKCAASIGALIILFLTLLMAPVRAQQGLGSDGKPSLDELVARELKDRKGVVIINAVLTEPGLTAPTPTLCSRLSLTIGGNINGRPFRKTLTPRLSPFFGKARFAGITALPEGPYLVLSVTCTNRGTSHFEGPHARFDVRAGQVFNVGTLKIYHIERPGLLFIPARAGAFHRSVEDLPPWAMDSIKEQLPQTSARIIKRPMVITGPPDITTQTQRCVPFQKCGL